MAETPAVCEHLHLPLQSGSDRVLAAMRRGYTAERYLDRLAAARAAIPDLAVTTDIIVGLPRRDRGRLRADPRGGGRGRVRQRLHLHLLAPSGDPGGGHDRRVRPRRGGGRAFRTAPGGGRALGPGPPPGPDRPDRGGHGRGPEQAGPGGGHRADPPEQAGPFPPAGGPGRRPAPTPTCTITGAAPHHLRGELVERDGPASPPGPHPRRPPAERRRCRRTVPGVRPWPSVGPTASGKSALALALARRVGRALELVSVDSMSVYRGMDIGTAKPTPSERAAVPPPPGRPGRPGRGVHRPAIPAGGPPPGRHRRRGHRALLVGGTGLYLRAVVDDLELPGRCPTVAARPREPRPTAPSGSRRAPLRPAGGARPGGRHPHRARPTAAGWSGPSRSPSDRAGRSLVRPRPGALPADAGRPGRASASTPAGHDAASTAVHAT